MTPKQQVVCLAGGVGGAKMADGLAQCLPPDQLTIIGNTGDDFEHWGLHISPDLDTLMYNLADIADKERGWGLADESWRVLEQVAALGGPAWFRLGDRDLATHVTRTAALREGQTLTDITANLCAQLGIQHRLLPMCDAAVPTRIETETAILDFQTWFVRERWQPTVKQVHLPDEARATQAAIRAIEQTNVVIIAPSNPFVSIDPILNAYPLKALVMDMPQVVVAVSPIIAGKAVKGPAAKLLAAFGLPVSAVGVAHYYDALLDGFVCDTADAPALAEALPDLPNLGTPILMQNRAERRGLAERVLAFAERLSHAPA